MRPTTVLSLIAAVFFGIGGLVIGAFLIFDHNLQQVKWHYWIAPLVMILTSITLFQLVAMYMAMVGRKELQSRPPSHD